MNPNKTRKMKITELTLADKIYKIVYDRLKFDGLLSAGQYPTIEENPITGIRMSTDGKTYFVDYNERYESDKMGVFSKKCSLEHDGKKVIKQNSCSGYNPSSYEEVKDIDKYAIDQTEAFKILERLCDENINKLIFEENAIRIKIEKFKILKKQEKSMPLQKDYKYEKK